MLACTNSCAMVGLEGFIIRVEVDLSPGVPRFNMVGLPDTAVQEAKERVRAALRNSGCEFPMRRITVNLAPADLKKEGPAYDLPIAVGILLSSRAAGIGARQRRISGRIVPGRQPAAHHRHPNHGVRGPGPRLRGRIRTRG